MAINNNSLWNSQNFSFVEKQLKSIISVLERPSKEESVLNRLACGYFDDLYDNENDLLGRIVKVFFCANNPKDSKNSTRVRAALEKTDQLYRSINASVSQNLFPSYEKILDEEFKEIGSGRNCGNATLEKWLCQYYQLFKLYYRTAKNPSSKRWLDEISQVLGIEGIPFFDKSIYLKVKTFVNLVLFKLYLNCEIPFPLLKRAAEWETVAYLEEDNQERAALKQWCEQISSKDDVGLIRKGIESFIKLLNDRHVSQSFPEYDCGNFLLNLNQLEFSLTSAEERHLKWRSSLRQGGCYPELAYQRTQQGEWIIPKLGPVIVGRHFKFDSNLIFEINEKEVLVIGCNRLMFNALEKAQKQFSSFLKTSEIIYTDPKKRFQIRKRLYRLEIKEYVRAISQFFKSCIEQKASPYEIEARHLLFDKNVSPPELKSTKGLMRASFSMMSLEKLAFDLFHEQPENYREVMKIFKEHKNFKNTYEKYQEYFKQILKEASKDSAYRDYQDYFFENIEDQGVIQAGRELYRTIHQLLEVCKKLIDEEYVSLARRRNTLVSHEQVFFEHFHKEISHVYKNQGGLGRIWCDADFERSLIERSKLFQKKNDL